MANPFEVTGLHKNINGNNQVIIFFFIFLQEAANPDK